jgi:hypothetical protein
MAVNIDFVISLKNKGDRDLICRRLEPELMNIVKFVVMDSDPHKTNTVPEHRKRRKIKEINVLEKGERDEEK